MPQAQEAAREGADVIAVIRSTGQSLLDYVPEGATREGFAGTYATQENFRLMRAALDETSKELGRYVRLTNYASGLCMPEIAALAGLERLDMMLNDSMYGILFRDINPVRTFVDQRFSRQVHARAGIIINTGEDNYLTTADAVEAAHTVTVSQLLNEYFAKEAGLEDWQLGLGHAFEIDPEVPDSFRLELAHALLARELFPDAPLKWMPPTRHMTGDVFRGYLLDAFFNLAGAMTGQSILLVGMMTEAVVTPWLSDRDLALQNVRYVMDAAGGLHEDFHPAPTASSPSGPTRCSRESIDLLERILAHESRTGLLDAIADGTFGLMKRPADARPRPRRRGPQGAAATSTPPPRSWRRRRVSHHSGRTATPPATAWCRCRSRCRSPHAKIAEGAAQQLANKMGMDPAMVVHAKPMGPDFTFFVVYGRVHHLVDTRRCRSWSATTRCSRPRRPTSRSARRLRRRLVVVGACIGTDAHTVGIDAILNIKGFAGEKGLEYYREIKVVNLGAQVSVPQLVARAREEKADAVLVSQVVTQRDAHLLNTQEMSAAFREAYPSDTRPLLIVGGPRFDETMAGELGVDRVFARGTTPGDVASYLVHPLVTQRKKVRASRRLTRMTEQTPGTRADRRPPPLRALRHAHYAGNLVDGAYGLGLFGDVATELCIRSDGDEGLFASYSDVQFRAPVRAGDCSRSPPSWSRSAPARAPWTSGAVVVGRGRPDRGGVGRRDAGRAVVATTATGRRGRTGHARDVVRTGVSLATRRRDVRKPGEKVRVARDGTR